MKSKLEIYALAVCFCCIGCMIISGSIAMQSLLRVAAPEMMVSGSEYINHQSNDTYVMVYGDEKKKKMSEAEITKLRENALANLSVQQRRDGIQSLLSSIIFFLSAAFTLGIHWRIAQKARA